MEAVLEHYEEGISPRRIAGIGFVILLHIGIIYALVSGLGDQVVQILRPPLSVKVIQDVKTPPPPPPPPPPQLVQPPPPYIPPPLIQIAQPPAPPVIATVTQVKPVAPPPPPVPVPVTRAASLDPNQTCTPPEYPPAAEEMQQTGRTVLQFLISPEGAVLNARIARSSGHDVLDQTAKQALSACKFRPAVGADGQPQEAWTSIAYDWTLN